MEARRGCDEHGIQSHGKQVLEGVEPAELAFAGHVQLIRDPRLLQLVQA